jgi:transposase
VGSRCDCTWILGLPGFRVERIEGEAADAHSRLRVFVERGDRRYPCSGCGRRTRRVRSAKERTWDDVPGAAHPVTLIYRQRRVRCRRCGIRTERIEFADAKVLASCWLASSDCDLCGGGISLFQKRDIV